MTTRGRVSACGTGSVRLRSVLHWLKSCGGVVRGSEKGVGERARERDRQRQRHGVHRSECVCVCVCDLALHPPCRLSHHSHAFRTQNSRAIHTQSRSIHNCDEHCSPAHICLGRAGPGCVVDAASLSVSGRCVAEWTQRPFIGSHTPPTAPPMRDTSGNYQLRNRATRRLFSVN